MLSFVVFKLVFAFSSFAFAASTSFWSFGVSVSIVASLPLILVKALSTSPEVFALFNWLKIPLKSEVFVPPAPSGCFVPDDLSVLAVAKAPNLFNICIATNASSNLLLEPLQLWAFGATILLLTLTLFAFNWYLCIAIELPLNCLTLKIAPEPTAVRCAIIP